MNTSMVSTTLAIQTLLAAEEMSSHLLSDFFFSSAYECCGVGVGDCHC